MREEMQFFDSPKLSDFLSGPIGPAPIKFKGKTERKMRERNERKGEKEKKRKGEKEKSKKEKQKGKTEKR